MNWLAGDECKGSRSAACLPAGSWGIIEMHGLVETQGCPDADVLAGCIFQGLILSQHLGTLPG